MASGSEAPRVLAIAGSPRRHGNSEALLDACIAAMDEAGGDVDKLAVVEHEVRPCLGCNACSLTGACVQLDGMQAIYPRIDAADAIVIASPVFFAGVPGSLKALYDRVQPYWARTYVLEEPRRERRPGAILMVRGGGGPFGFEGALLPTRSVLGMLGVDILGEVTVEGPDEPGDMARFPEALDEARALGVRVVEEAAR